MTLVKLDGAQEQIRGIVSRDLNPLAMGNCNWVPYDFPDIDMHRGRRRSAPVIGGAATVTTPQRVTALRHLLQNNIHGIATAMYKQYQANPTSFTAALANQGMNPATIIADMQMGNGKAAAAAISGRRVGASGAFPPPLSNIQFTANNTGKPFTGPATGLPNNMFLNALLSSIAAGQDANGYYGWWGTSNNAFDNFWSGADADADLRTAYSNAGVWWGGNNNINPYIPPPKAKGADINVTAAPPSKTVVQDVAAAAVPIINSLVPGAGTLLNSLVGNAPGTTSPSNPGNIPPPPPPAMIPGFFTPTVMIAGAAVIAVGIGLLIAFND